MPPHRHCRPLGPVDLPRGNARGPRRTFRLITVLQFNAASRCAVSVSSAHNGGVPICAKRARCNAVPRPESELDNGRTRHVLNSTVAAGGREGKGGKEERDGGVHPFKSVSPGSPSKRGTFDRAYGDGVTFRDLRSAEFCQWRRCVMC